MKTFDKVVTDPQSGETFGFFYSEALNLESKINLNTKEIILNQKDQSGNFISYSKRESEILSTGIGEITPKIHLIKKFFCGKIVQ